MAGGYDEATMRRLGEQLSAQRLLQMVTQLQSAASGLARSANRRTDAELCLIRLSDEELDESLSGLAARVARLEERAAQDRAAEKPVFPQAAPRSAASPVRTEPSGGSSSRSDDPPPWEEERPPLPEEPPEEPDYVFDPPEPPAAPSRPATASAAPAQPPQAPAREAAPGDSSFWPSFAAGLRGKVPPTVIPYLNNPAKVAGVWQNGKLTLWVDSEFTRSMLNKPAVLEKLSQAAAGVFGGDPQVSVVTGTPPKSDGGHPPPAAKDPLDDLMSFGGLDNITIQ